MWGQPQHLSKPVLKLKSCWLHRCASNTLYFFDFYVIFVACSRRSTARSGHLPHNVTFRGWMALTCVITCMHLTFNSFWNYLLKPKSVLLHVLLLIWRAELIPAHKFLPNLNSRLWNDKTLFLFSKNDFYSFLVHEEWAVAWNIQQLPPVALLRCS